jgi:hypothetical protein
MKHFGYLFVFALIMSCSDHGIEPEEHKTVPNQSPTNLLQPVPVEELVSTAELLEMQKIREQEERYRHMADDPELSLEQPKVSRQPDLTDKPSMKQPRDFRCLDPGQQSQTAREYREALLRKKGAQPLVPLPPPPAITDGIHRRTRGEQGLSRQPGAGSRKSPSPQKQEPSPRRNGGGRIFSPRVRENVQKSHVSSVIPPGRFWKAKLIGNATVTLFSPIIFAEIFDPQGQPIGTAIGEATLHRHLNDRALLKFNRIHLYDGRTVSGDLIGFEADKSMGLIGDVERQSFKRFAFALADTILGALSLEVETDGDSFGNVFKFNLADRLLDQANNRLREINLDRRIYLQRDTSFFVASVKETTLGQIDYSSEIDEISFHAREALNTTIHSSEYSDSRKRELNHAYQRLSSRLKSLPN